MKHEIRITFTDEVTAAVALNVVKASIINDIEPGEVITFNNGVAVEYRNNTKNQCFYVWKREGK